MERLDTIIRKLASDPSALYAAYLAIENEAIERRDMGLGEICANGITVNHRDGLPSPIIRISTRNAVKLALEAIADMLANERLNES